MNLNNDWRKTAAAIYHKPIDSKVFGSVEIDVTELEKFINRKRREGLKITLTHIFTLAVARALKDDVPELNCYIKRGRIVLRDQIDAMVSVLVDDSEMSSVQILHADELNLQDLSEKLSQGIKEIRTGIESGTMQMKNKVARIPWPFRQWLLNFVKWLTISLGVAIPAIGLNTNNFGSFVITNIGSLGLDNAYPSLFPISNVAMVFVLGGVAKKPVVVNDKIEIRRMITLSATMDHRIVDGIHGGKLFKVLREFVRHPEKLEEVM